MHKHTHTHTRSATCRSLMSLNRHWPRSSRAATVANSDSEFSDSGGGGNLKPRRLQSSFYIAPGYCAKGTKSGEGCCGSVVKERQVLTGRAVLISVQGCDVNLSASDPQQRLRQQGLVHILRISRLGLVVQDPTGTQPSPCTRRLGRA